MANFCHACAQPVTQDMRACPHCGTVLAAGLPPQHHTVPQGAAQASTSAGWTQPPHGAGTGAPGHGGHDGHGGYVPPRAAPFSSNSPLGAMFAPPARYAKAPLGARFLAHLLDTLISAAAMIPGIIVIALGAEGGGDGFAVAGGLLLLVGGVWALFYSLAKDGFEGGASIGKRMMGLMVVHLPTNLPCTQGKSAIRAVVMVALGFIPFIGWLVEPIAVLAADGGRRLGDHAASTQVIAVGEYANRAI